MIDCGTIPPQYGRRAEGLRAVGISDHAAGELNSHGCRPSRLGSLQRGNLGDEVVIDLVGGSIPARAGEPHQQRQNLAFATVYPRACGGTDDIMALPIADIGLSPRVRGNHPAGVRQVRLYGSIPARAGEPLGLSAADAKRRVYPRACGGTHLERVGY